MSGRLLHPRLGVLGGLGPLATADFYRKTIDVVPALGDADHIAQVILSVPQIPDRSRAIVEGNDRPLPWLAEAVDLLNSLNVELIAIACNTAHHWYDELASRSKAEIVHIADATICELHRQYGGARLAILATQGTLSSGFYQRRLRLAGFDCDNPATPHFQRAVDDAVHLVKVGRLEQAKIACAAAFSCCREEGVEVAVLACTELPIAAEGIVPEGMLAIDSTMALVRECERRLRAMDRALDATG
jgi:aspartate racemase